ncbi:MAG: M20/M25/M40 family metallo-hydrolase [Desulfurococcales archaeon]|nr:M20/M25/M40 family metallo-hydrolase [Desulfurococcales archaeon]
MSRSARLASVAGRVLWRLVNTYSPTGGEEAGVRVFLEEAERLGLDAWTDGVGNAYAAPRRQGGRPLYGLVGHIDTIDDWFEPSIEGDSIRGRGAVDAKGPLASMLAAAAAVAEADPGAPLVVAALVGEEGDSRGARGLAASGRVPLNVVIGEPTGGDRVVIAYRGQAILRVECTARGGHPASPWAGESAADLLVEAYTALRSLYPGASLSQPTLTPLRLEARGPSNALPTRAEAIVDARIPPGAELGEVLSRAAAALPRGCRLEVAGPYTPPVRVSLNSPVPRALVRAALLEGLRPRPAVKAGTSDMNVLAPHAGSIAAYGPGDPSLAHTRLEEVGLAELGLAARVYLRAYRILASRGN